MAITLSTLVPTSQPVPSDTACSSQGSIISTTTDQAEKINTTTASSSSLDLQPTRAYVLPANPGEKVVHEARLISGEWVLGTIDEQGQWSPLAFRAKFHSRFFDFTNAKELDEDGESHVGKSASLVLNPVPSTVPDGVIFQINPQDLFGEHRLEVDLGGKGKVFFDNRVYAQQRNAFNDLVAEITAEPSNPAIDSAVKTLSVFTQFFPHRAKEMANKGHATVVLILNRTEKFMDTPFPGANGWHDEEMLSVFQISEDGENVLLHSLHEVGGLFRILKNKYAHGFTWGLAFDQGEALSESPEKRSERQLNFLNRLISSIDKTAKREDVEDFSHNIEYYIDVDDPYFQGGYLMYAHGSGIVWKWINTALTEQGLPNVYDLINDIHHQGLDGLEGNELDKLISAYNRINPARSTVFAELVNRYFRTFDLGMLKEEAIERKKQLEQDRCATGW